jgi:hypothetical protein
MPLISMLRAVLAIVAVFIVPGWFLLSFFEAWRRWPGLQRWIVAVGLSAACYPAVFYWSRLALPFWRFGPYKAGLMLAALAVAVLWRTRTHWRDLFRFDAFEWAAIAVFGMTLFTRFWVIRDLPYPAWSDSLHHVLLTQLTAASGRLPSSLEPYFPIPLGQYHLGLYALSGLVEWLADVPAHTALLWTAQVLNGLCGIGVYLVLDRKVGRAGAVVGAAVVGLLSHQPAFYVNWGRFTQVSSQTILLVAWIVSWDAVAQWQEHGRSAKDGPRLVWNALLAAGLSGAVFLLHFRVAVFYLPLLLGSVVWESWKARQSKSTPQRSGHALQRLGAVLVGTGVLGLLALIIIAPAAVDACRIYLTNLVHPVALPAETARAQQQEYFEFAWDVVPILVAPAWLLILTALSAVFALVRRNRLVPVALTWALLLYLLGNAHWLGIAALNLTNLGAVLIMLYLPVGLIIGAAAQELSMVSQEGRERASWALVALAMFAGFVASHARVTEIEPFRYFVTPEDVAGMDWIRKNTEADATFAVNTYMWLPGFPHGTDAGYWIPYFTGRSTTAGVMLLPLGSLEYGQRIAEMSSAVQRLSEGDSSLEELRRLGIDYVYVGARGNFSGPGLNVSRLSQFQGLTLAYQTPHVAILRVSAS